MAEATCRNETVSDFNDTQLYKGGARIVLLYLHIS